MKKNAITRLLYLGLLLFSASLHAQQNLAAKEKIAGYFSKYFEPDRENLHVHFDKSIFFTDEAVWFKGYVFNRKAGLPFYNTTNVHMQLMDESGKILTSQLLYSVNGLFSGKVVLDTQWASGNYYLQFYTNWMNNFAEDESYVQRIKIINPQENTTGTLELLNTAKINIAFFPEGGHLISGIPNNVGTMVTDINGKAIPDVSFEIWDQNNIAVKTVGVNAQGMGKFEFLPDGTNFKAVIRRNDSTFEYPLPTAQANGITFEVNNYLTEGKTFVKLKPSASFLAQNTGKLFFLVIQQDEKSNIVELTLTPESQNKEIAIGKENFFQGVNTLRIIDAELTQYAHRYLYESQGNPSRFNMAMGHKKDNRVDLSGNCDAWDACMSIAVLPVNSLLPSPENMFTSLYLNSYLNEKVIARRELFSNLNRNKKFELDLLMLNQSKNKYDWENIKSGPPVTHFEFESGVQLKGTINVPATGLKRYKVELRTQLNEILGRTEVTEKNEFYFKDTNVTDSLQLFCDLIHMDQLTKKDMSYQLVVTNKNKKYNKNYRPAPYYFPSASEIEAAEIPKFANNTILLDPVAVGKRKTLLKRQFQPGNSYLRGTKITEQFENTTVLDFIQRNGFNVSNYLGQIIIQARIPTSLNAAQYTVPLVFIDGRQLMAFDELFGMRMEELDEIYLSTTAIVPSMTNNHGIIKMYRKIPDYRNTGSKVKPHVIIGGFKPITSFSNADYASVYNVGFENFGIIDWEPWVISDNNGNLRISIDNPHYKKVKVIVEGFTVQGKIISEVREINLQE